MSPWRREFGDVEIPCLLLKILDHLRGPLICVHSYGHDDDDLPSQSSNFNVHPINIAKFERLIQCHAYMVVAQLI
jgi:hypothetical protein